MLWAPPLSSGGGGGSGSSSQRGSEEQEHGVEGGVVVDVFRGGRRMGLEEAWELLHPRPLRKSAHNMF